MRKQGISQSKISGDIEWDYSRGYISFPNYENKPATKINNIHTCLFLSNVEVSHNNIDLLADEAPAMQESFQTLVSLFGVMTLRIPLNQQNH